MNFLKLVIALLLIPFLFVACASTSSDPTAKDFRVVFAEENARLHQNLASISGFKFRDLTLEDYKFRMQKQNPELLKQIEAYDEVILGTSPAAFVICVKSVAQNIAMCDNGKSAFVDRIKMQTPLPELSVLMDEVRGP